MSDVRTLAVANTLRFLQPNDNYMNSGEVGVRIERDVDLLIYDAGNSDPTQRVFKADSACTNPFILLNAGTGNSTGRLEASITLDANFTDGEYVINFHDMRYPTHNIFAMDLVTVWNGSAAAVKPFTDMDLCLRILNINVAAHKTPAGSYGAWMNSMLAIVTDIQTKVTAIQTKLGA